MPRCPNGSRRNKKSGLCEPNKDKKIKQCPPEKILNPKTKRCIKNTTANRNKLKSNIKSNQYYIIHKRCKKGNKSVELNDVKKNVVNNNAILPRNGIILIF